MVLLFLSQHEARMGRVNVRTKQAFYLAEAGIEDARRTLFNSNADEDFDNDLQAAAGPDTDLDFDRDALQVNYDADGNITGLSGYNDDVPLRSLTQIGDPKDNGI